MAAVSSPGLNASEKSFRDGVSPNPSSGAKGRRTLSANDRRVNYTSQGVTNNDLFSLPGSDWSALGALIVVATAVRLFRISQPTSVVFDEVHFGGFASKYIRGAFFMDVHPPLAKLLITLAGWLAGFDGEFDFKEIGKDYIEPGVPYVAMRLVSAISGILTIPTMFLTLKVMGCRTATATLGAGLIIFENGLVTQSRLILLDSPLVIMTAFTALSFMSFTNQQEQGPSKAFTPTWWFWLAATGVGLGATVSVKWVGLFTIAWVGSLTIIQLWALLADYVNVTPRLWFKHVFARLFCLIVIPAAIYLALFGIHFLCLQNPGEGDGFMSSEFQATLNSKGMADVPVDVAFGSRIALRHWNTQGGYLHSHAHMYPTGSKQQQITLYPHKDENNLFLLENQTQPEVSGAEVAGPFAWDDIAPTPIKDGDILRLYHVQSDRRLHSHDVRPPVSEAEWQNEVSAYGYEGFEGDANDLFRVDIVKHLSEGEMAKENLRTIQSKFRLIHVMTGCVLFSHKVKLPDWGFEQQEVTCAKQGSLPNSVWYVEDNQHPKLAEDAEKVNYRNPGFLGKFIELQQVMWRTNAGLVESHAWDSRPPSWPTLLRGINFWGKDNRQIYLMGNPVVWWSAAGAIAIYAVVKGFALLRWQRGYNDYQGVEFKRFDYEIGMTVLGWAFHYFPFYLMERQLFLHHYFPALYFSVIVFAQIFDFVTARFSAFGLKSRPAVGSTVVVAILAASIAVFTMYAPLAYGNMWTREECKRVQLLDGWDWDCNIFHNSYSEYALAAPQKSAASSSVAPPVSVNVPDEEQPNVTPKGPSVPQEQLPEGVVAREEKLIYRDDKGNILNEEQVKALQGKVEFRTLYETHTRVLDGPGDHAPPHPDIEGADPSTKDKDRQDDPPKDQKKTVEEGNAPKQARPASDANEKTV